MPVSTTPTVTCGAPVVMSHASGARILAMPHSYAKQASFGVALWRMTWSGPA
jgi:hypothetical protein